MANQPKIEIPIALQWQIVQQRIGRRLMGIVNQRVNRRGIEIFDALGYDTGNIAVLGRGYTSQEVVQKKNPTLHHTVRARISDGAILEDESETFAYDRLSKSALAAFGTLVFKRSSAGFQDISKKSKWEEVKNRIIASNWYNIEKLASGVEVSESTFEDYRKSQGRPFVALIDKNMSALEATTEDWGNGYLFLKAEAALRGAQVVVRQDQNSHFRIPLTFTDNRVPVKQ